MGRHGKLQVASTTAFALEPSALATLMGSVFTPDIAHDQVTYLELSPTNVLVY